MTMTFVPWFRSGIGSTITSGTKNRPDASVVLTVEKTPTGGTAAPLSVTIPTGDIANGQATVGLRMLGPGDVVGIAPGEIAQVFPGEGSAGIDTRVFPAVVFRHPELPWMFSPTAPSAPSPNATAPNPTIPSHLQPWCCLITVKVQPPAVSLDPSTGWLTIESPANLAEELPNLAEAYLWSHVQYPTGDLTVLPVGTGAAQIAASGASASRLLSARRLEANATYICAVVPTYAAGVTAGLGGNPNPDDAPAFAWPWPPPSSIVLPTYFSFQFSTGAGGDFASLANLLFHKETVSGSVGSGVGERTLMLPPTPPGLASLPASEGLPAVLAEIGTNAPYTPPAPSVVSWLEGELTPPPSPTAPPPPAPPPQPPPPQLRLPLYGAVQGGIQASDLPGAFTAAPWFEQLNCDPGLRVLAALGAAVVAADQDAIVSAAWKQIGDALAVNALLNRAQCARMVGNRQVARHIGPQVSDPLSVLQLVSPQSSRMALGVTDQASTTTFGTIGQLVAQSSDPALAATLSAAYRRLSRPGTASARTAPAAPQRSTSLDAPSVLAAMAPSNTVPTRVVGEFLTPTTQAVALVRPDQLRAMAPAVHFTTAMINQLVALSPNAVLPGAATIGPNTALVLESNPEAIAAYMVGVNTAASALFNWRGLPTDRRATFFQNFWDSGSADISPISSWTGSLAGTMTAPELVLAIRAEVLRRYPNTVVYVVDAASSTTAYDPFDPNNASHVHMPVFTATLPPDLQVFGFAVSPGLDYFFVLQEHFAEIRFGSDNFPAAAQTLPGYWAWSDFGSAVPPPSNLSEINQDSANVATAAWQPPVVVYLGAADLVPNMPISTS